MLCVMQTQEGESFPWKRGLFHDLMEEVMQPQIQEQLIRVSSTAAFLQKPHDHTLWGPVDYDRKYKTSPRQRDA